MLSASLGKFELGTQTVQTLAVCSSVDSPVDLLLFYLMRVPFPVNSTQQHHVFLKKSSRESFHNLSRVSTLPGVPQTAPPCAPCRQWDSRLVPSFHFEKTQSQTRYRLSVCLINSMEHSPSWEANSSLATQIPQTLFNSQVHYRIQNSTSVSWV